MAHLLDTAPETTPEVAAILFLSATSTASITLSAVQTSLLHKEIKSTSKQSNLRNLKINLMKKKGSKNILDAHAHVCGRDPTRSDGKRQWNW